MKLRRLLAATAAAAVATSAMAVVASAVEHWGGDSGNSGLIASWRTNDGTEPLFENSALVSTITKIEIVATADDVEQVAEDVADGIYMGGAFIVNSNSTGWSQVEYNLDGSKDIGVVIDTDAETITLTRDNGTPIFADSDTYCLVNHHDWSNTTSVYNFTVVDVIPYNAEGVDVRTLDGAVADEPVVDEPVVDEPVVDEPVDEPVVDEPVVDEPVVDEPVVDEPAVDEPAVDTDAPATETGKDSPDTGVEGIAAVAGVVALAGVAVVASRKRK